jgi:hypothetical protein
MTRRPAAEPAKLNTNEAVAGVGGPTGQTKDERLRQRFASNPGHERRAAK